jgi:hypothetical protein
MANLLGEEYNPFHDVAMDVIYRDLLCPVTARALKAG